MSRISTPPNGRTVGLGNAGARVSFSPGSQRTTFSADHKTSERGILLFEEARAISSPNSHPHRTEIKVRFAETDAQGIVHNAVYLVWFEVARVEYLARHAGGYPALRARGIEALTTESRVRYLVPVRFDDRLRVHTTCGDMRGARFRFEYVIERDGEAVADGWTAHACVDAETFRPTRMPPWLAQAIATAER